MVQQTCSESSSQCGCWTRCCTPQGTPYSTIGYSVGALIAITVEVLLSLIIDQLPVVAQYILLQYPHPQLHFNPSRLCRLRRCEILSSSTKVTAHTTCQACVQTICKMKARWKAEVWSLIQHKSLSMSHLGCTGYLKISKNLMGVFLPFTFSNWQIGLTSLSKFMFLGFKRKHICRMHLVNNFGFAGARNDGSLKKQKRPIPSVTPISTPTFLPKWGNYVLQT